MKDIIIDLKREWYLNENEIILIKKITEKKLYSLKKNVRPRRINKEVIS